MQWRSSVVNVYSVYISQIQKSAARGRKSLGVGIEELKGSYEKLVNVEVREASEDDGEEQESAMRLERDEGAGEGTLESQSDEDTEVATSDEEQSESEGGGAAAAEAGEQKSGHSSSLYKPPTRDELQTLKETQNLFKSNLMKLQVCSECRILFQLLLFTTTGRSLIDHRAPW